MRNWFYEWARLILAAMAMLSLHAAAMAQPIAQPLEHPRGNLVSAEWLRTNLRHPKIALIDTSQTPAHRAKHIPGAAHYDFYADGGRDLPSAAAERRFQSLGINSDSVVVLYDEGGEIGAANLFFLLTYYGFPRAQLYVLDGGIARWAAIGGEIVGAGGSAPPPVRAGNFRPAEPNAAMRVGLNAFLTASADTRNHVLVDALPADYYFGGAKFFDRGGHVPHAVNMPSEDFFNADKTFKSRAEILRIARQLGITREQQILSHCGGGVAATVPWFAFSVLLDFPNVQVYRESQREWLRDARGLPFWTYAAPRMLREPQWLNSWNHWMLRGAGASKLNIIDVRSAADYGRGHIAYAVNVPGTVMARGLADPAALAKTLSAAGVNATDEAVIISDGGLNPSSALALLALHTLGHEHVSVLSATHDEWEQAGYTLTKEPTTVGIPKSPKDFMLRPAAYTPTHSRAAPIARKTTPSPETPRIYLSSGAAPSATPGDGKAIHLPYTRFVNTDGKPKPAHEIWTILEKAGVSRYAEIVTVADSVGDAAVNYAVLKLMGFSNVKVMQP
jgi:thiosulfate/3-mercaptopyruvate sulfurtransferase